MTYPNPGDQPQYPNPPERPNLQKGGEGQYGGDQYAGGQYAGQPGGYAPPPYGGYPQPRQGNGLAVAGLVCGIIGLLILWFILSPLAIIFGGIGLSRANKGASGKGMAIAAIVLGIVGLIGYIILIAVVASNGSFVY